MQLLKTGILSVCLILLDVGLAGGGVTTRPATSQPATSQSVAVPGQIGLEFLKGLEAFLSLEHRDRQEAERILRSVSGLISDEPLKSWVAMKGKRLSDLSEKEANASRKDLAGSWAAIINFYTGYIDYKRMRVVTFSKSAKPEVESAMAQVLFPAQNPAFPRPVNILVLLIEESNTWKVKSVILLPGKPKSPQTQPK
jgi:hypothetical protein